MTKALLQKPRAQDVPFCICIIIGGTLPRMRLLIFGVPANTAKQKRWVGKKIVAAGVWRPQVQFRLGLALQALGELLAAAEALEKVAHEDCAARALAQAGAAPAVALVCLWFYCGMTRRVRVLGMSRLGIPEQRKPQASIC